MKRFLLRLAANYVITLVILAIMFLITNARNVKTKTLGYSNQ
jgi:hypothetical protein